MSLDVQNIRCDDQLHGRFAIRSFDYLDILMRNYRINHGDVILVLDIGAFITVDSPRLLSIHTGYHPMDRESQNRIDESSAKLTLRSKHKRSHDDLAKHI